VAGSEQFDRQVGQADRLTDHRTLLVGITIDVVVEHQHPPAVRIGGEKCCETGLFDVELHHTLLQVVVDGCPEQDAALNRQQPLTAAADARFLADRARRTVGRDDVLSPHPVVGARSRSQRDGHAVVVPGEVCQLGAGP